MLEIGCGWGSFALHAAQTTGCRVTGADDLGRAGAARARARRARRGSPTASPIVEQDFREHDGRYTKVASIEMLEAIGERQFGPYFATIDRVLEPGGIACVQTILIPDDRWDRYRTLAGLDRALRLPGLPDPVARPPLDVGGDRARRG